MDEIPCLLGLSIRWEELVWDVDLNLTLASPKVDDRLAPQLVGSILEASKLSMIYAVHCPLVMALSKRSLSRGDGFMAPTSCLQM